MSRISSALFNTLAAVYWQGVCALSSWGFAERLCGLRLYHEDTKLQCFTGELTGELFKWLL